MSEVVPVWRQALSDDQHPLNRAGWLLFSKKFNVKYVQDVLKPQQDEVVDFCYTILDTDELYGESSLGRGCAPTNAIELLSAWKVESALPRMLQILTEEDWATDIYGVVADGIAAYGTAVVEPLLEIATNKTEDQVQVAIAGTLADAAPGDPRAVAFVKKIYDSRKQDFEIAYMAENVMQADPEGGADWLRERLRTHKYSKDVRKRIEGAITGKLEGKY